MNREKRTPKKDSEKGSRAAFKMKIAEKIDAKKKANEKEASAKVKQTKRSKKKNGGKPNARKVTKIRTAKTST